MQRIRFSAWISLAVMAMLAGATYWLLQINLPRTANTAIQEKTHTPDYFADNFSISILDQSGMTQYRIAAASMLHYEDDSATYAAQPIIRAFSPDQPVVTASGKRGIINADGSIIDLYDDARIVRNPSAAEPRMQAHSEHFRVLTNDDVIETEKPVKLQRGPSVMTANSMTYNNVTRKVRLFGQVRGMIAASDTAPGGPLSK